MGMVRVFDPLYGEICLSSPVAELVLCPALQRLREIRLSNIDSVRMPGIANVSRHEHVVGAAYLATQAGFFSRLSRRDAVVFEAAALLHDVGIAPFGHLVEEALQYKSVKFNHEKKFATLLEQGGAKELGGVELQLYAGHESGIRAWADRAFGNDSDECLGAILASIAGQSPFGGVVGGGLDVDNLDNLTRIAFHMGLEVDRTLPLRIAASMLESKGAGPPVFSASGVEAAREWLDLRWRVYSRLMLAREDFAGKAMLIFATVNAFELGELGPEEYVWTLTDREIVERLLRSADGAVVQAIRSWLLRDLWPVSDLWWMEGSAPDFSRVYEFGKVVGTSLGRPCVAYRITDKRVRRLSLPVQGNGVVEIGEEPGSWVLGVVSAKRGAFSGDENRKLKAEACAFFGADCVGEEGTNEREQAGLRLFE